MNKKSFKHLSLISVASITLTACGGGSDSNGSQTSALPDTNTPTVP